MEKADLGKHRVLLIRQVFTDDVINRTAESLHHYSSFRNETISSISEMQKYLFGQRHIGNFYIKP